jgi:hypothetical protein
MWESHIVRLWYTDDVDAMQRFVDCWEFCIIAYAVPKFALCCKEVMRWTMKEYNLPTCTYSNLAMVYVEVMLGKHINQSLVIAHSRADITKCIIDIPTNIN